MKKLLFLMLTLVSVLFTACEGNNDDMYLFHFTTSYKTSTKTSGDAIDEIQSYVDFDKVYQYSTSRKKAIALAQSEFDKVMGNITKDYTEAFAEEGYVTISMTMFAPDNEVIDTKQWGSEK